MKVYLAQVGLREFVVAAADQQAALSILGVGEDLFAIDAACEVADEELTTIALAAPGKIFERPVWARRKRYDPCRTPVLPPIVRSDAA